MHRPTSSRRLAGALPFLALLAAAPAAAQEQPPAADPPPPEEPAPPAEPAEEPAPAAPGEPDTEERIRALEEQNEELREELELLTEDLEDLDKRHTALLPIKSRLSGYLDVGFFAVTGDGSGIRADTGYRHFPEYEDSGIPASWVFYGDPLSTAVNARGEPASTGESRAVTFDPIGSGTSSFILNSLNVALFAEVGQNLLFTAKVDVVPRSRDVSDPDGTFVGDFVDLRLGYLEYRIPRDSVRLSLFAGKFDSVVGFEYRGQEAPTRIEVTPSLICRYTCGYPIGVKARAELLDDSLTFNLAVTNGSSFTEGFPFNNEIDTNHFKTVSGRLSYLARLAGELEIGVSGSYGAQDGQMEEDVAQWLVAADAHYHRHDLVLRAEYVQGRARGETEPGSTVPCGLSPCLEFKGAYGLAGYRLTNILMPYVRVDWRDALHESGASFVYISELLRATAGLRLNLNPHLIVKGEYTVNRELGRAPQFPNDVFTSALVVNY